MDVANDFDSIVVPSVRRLPLYRDHSSNMIVGYMSGDAAAITAYLDSLKPFGISSRHRSCDYCLVLEPQETR